MKTALITGASSGIGETFAQELAAKNYNLVLVARSEDKLQQLAQQLQKQHQIQADVIVQDLTIAEAGQKIFHQIEQQGLTIDLLINNAGFGDYGAFSDRSLSKQMAMIQLNITALVELTGLFLPVMKQRGDGAIINLSSIAAFQPLPYMSVYAASKAFVLSFTEALWAENQDSGVHFLALCPGPTESQFFEVADFPASFKKNSNKLTPAEDVVKEALNAIEKNHSTVVTGGIANQFIVNLPRFLPRNLLVNAVKKQFRP
ncbi:short-chain dehydrogenase/reductase SDR [Stanieria cyanosphaera PCC 7437]|uniref:Short-chain dehydrogenase/reductase SDR n=1 Tax=Stanieria cyanosphaera (strain ATCC 29371 / PCC 7437) TaxID=111780 RepID=K9XV13_STAC7|nr:SDR family oxidoreductase [Stanieria cyanosphaera]AFZ36440.1 short-chain dehydrogenase/reductase SDR [Stanieria cyanosphaera PCC 7437]